MPRTLHITNAAGRDATVGAHGLAPEKGPSVGLPGHTIHFARYLATNASGLDEALAASLGDAYGEQLVQGDPEIDLELVGRAVGATDRVYLSRTGEVLYAAPRILEIITNPDGSERLRREPEDVPATVDDELPARWTGRKISLRDAVRRFAFRRTIQLTHVDGLTYDYLYAMAKELAEEGMMVRLGAGPRGRKPLILQYNGAPYQGFLEGRIDGDRYQLLLHLTNLELKRPEATP